MKRSAEISSCERYRYNLIREWDPNLKRVLFVMLNPSTADGESDDPTIRRCINFAKSWGYGSLEVVNLFAWRATEPKELKGNHLRTGTDNVKYLKKAQKRADIVIHAWGDSCDNLGIEIPFSIYEQLATMKAFCLGKNKSGNPKHPLYVKADTEPLRYPFK